MKKGTKVIFNLWDKHNVATVMYYDKSTGNVDLKYKGSKLWIRAHESDCIIVK